MTLPPKTSTAPSLVNLKAVFLCTQAVLPAMRSRHSGRIINVSLIGAHIGAGSVSVAYGAERRVSKA